MTTHIVALGGGGFATSSLGAPTALDRWLVSLTGKRNPLVCFVPTASADDPVYIRAFLTAYGTLGVRPMVLTLWTDAANAVRRIRDADLVLVGNGNTINMLALWGAHGVDAALQERYHAGDVVLAGTSAGGNVWFSGCVTDSFGDFRAWRGGLGMVPGSFCSHFDSEDGRVGVYTDAVASGFLPGGYACDDGAGVLITDGVLAGGVADAPGRRVLAVSGSSEPTASGVLAQPLEVTVV